MRIEVTIPGEPYALKRARRSFRRGGKPMMFDPEENADWKATAKTLMFQAMAGRQPLAGPVSLEVIAAFSMPRSRWLKRSVRKGGWHTKRPDLDNVVKAVKDAAKSVLWHDDCQVCELSASKIILDQGAAPSLSVVAEECEDV